MKFRTILVALIIVVAADIALDWNLSNAEVAFIVLVVVVAASFAGQGRIGTTEGEEVAMQKMPTTRFVFSILIALAAPFAAGFAHGATAAPEAGIEQSEGLSVACAPERPVVYPGESVAVKTWVTDLSGSPVKTPLQFAWKGSEGEIAGAATADWEMGRDVPKGEAGREVTSTVVVRDEQNRVGQCEATVIVAKPQEKSEQQTRAQNRASFLSGTSLLLPEAKEPEGYGLYSYLLFDSPPKSDLARKRYLSAIRAYLYQLPTIKELEQYRAKKALNITLMPIKRNIAVPVNFNDSNSLKQTAEQLLAVYDYPRAQLLLAEMGKDGYQSGPYMFSRTPGGSKQNDTLFFNMSKASPELISDWVNAFRLLTSQQHSWSAMALRKLGLQVRNVIAVSAGATPVVFRELQEWIRVMTPQ